MQTCVTKGWWQVRKYWVLQRKRGMNRGNLVNGCWPGLIIAAHKSCVSATPQPLERFLFRYLYKLLILLLHGTQSGYLHAGAKPESSVKADINRYSNWDFYSFSFSFTAARIPLQINYPRVIFFWRLCQRKSVFFFMCSLWADGYEWNKCASQIMRGMSNGNQLVNLTSPYQRGLSRVDSTWAWSVIIHTTV